MKTASAAGVVFRRDEVAVVMTFVGEDRAGSDWRKKMEQPKLPACTDRPDCGPSS